MSKITFAELFGTAIQNALHVRTETELANGESLDIEIRLPKDGVGEFALSGVTTASMMTYVFLDCLFEVFDNEGNLVKSIEGAAHRAHKLISFFVNSTGIEPSRAAGFGLKNDNVYGVNEQVKFWLKSGGMYTVRLTNTGRGGPLPLRSTSVSGINVPTPKSPAEAELSARLDQLERDVYGLQ